MTPVINATLRGKQSFVGFGKLENKTTEKLEPIISMYQCDVSDIYHNYRTPFSRISRERSET